MLELDVEAQDGLVAVRHARRAVVAELQRGGLGGLAEDAGLAVGELVANAVLHGVPPVQVRLCRLGAGVRLMVLDASVLGPESLDVGPDQPVGRGLVVVGALTARWGWERRRNGKVVWCDLPSWLPPDHDTLGLIEQDEPSTGQDEPSTGQDEPSTDPSPSECCDPVRRWTVRVPDIPVGVFRDFVWQVEEQLRELRLAATSRMSPTVVGLADQIRDWTGRPGDRSLLRGQAATAAREGRERTDVVLDLSLTAVDGARRHLAASDEVDARARAGELLLLESSAALRCFRRWFLQELAAGVQRAAGGDASPPRRFETVLLGEVEHRLPAILAARAEAVFERLLDTAPDAMLAIDSSGVIRWANQQVEVLFGYARPDLVGRPLDLLVPERHRDLHSQHQARYTAHPVTRPMGAVQELSGRRRDGSQFPADISLACIDTENGPLTMAAVRDLTSARAAREAARESRQIAEALQRGMLGVVPPRIGELAVAARYHPAQSGVLVGGDWHQVFPLDAGSVGISVGDVGGTGIEAAITMGRLRTALTALAVDEPSPGEVLGKVNRIFWRLAGAGSPAGDMSSELLATALYGRLDTTTGELVYAVAGHAGPVLIDPSQGTAWLHEPAPNLPLGLETNTRFREQTLRLPRDAKLLVYTDGLVERRETPLQESLDTLVLLARSLGGDSVDVIADALLDAATASSPYGADDIALIVVHWNTPRRQSWPASSRDLSRPR